MGNICLLSTNSSFANFLKHIDNTVQETLNHTELLICFIEFHSVILACETDSSAVDDQVKTSVKDGVRLHSDSNHSVRSHLGCLLFDLNEQLLSNIRCQFAKAFDFATNHAFQARPNVAEDISAFYLADNKKSPVLLADRPHWSQACVSLNLSHLPHFCRLPM